MEEAQAHERARIEALTPLARVEEALRIGRRVRYLRSLERLDVETSPVEPSD